MTCTTESSSRYNHLERMSTNNLLIAMNNEDSAVPLAIKKILPAVERLTKAVIQKMKNQGRLFYIGAGTSGRLGIVDASEIPPTYGLPPNRVIGLIAGGDTAIRKAVEHAEDNDTKAWQDLSALRINSNDILIGLSSSGATPYVVGGLRDAQKRGILTGVIVCNKKSEAANYANFPVEIIVGSELVTGSTRLKAGTAQKMVLNMISTCTMIKLGHVKGNKMIDMRPSNNKLIKRGIAMIMGELGISQREAKKKLALYGNVRKALESK